MSLARLALVVTTASALSLGCSEGTASRSTTSSCVPAELVARRGTPELQGDLDQPVWHAAAATSPFVDERRVRSVPHTEARAAWDDSALHLALYVADAELRTGDRVEIGLDGGRSIEVTPAGSLRCRFGDQTDCSALGVKAAFHVDGDVDASEEEDEEWSLTLSVPWKALSPAGRPQQLPISFQRDDVGGKAPLHLVWTRTCGAIRLD